MRFSLHLNQPFYIIIFNQQSKSLSEHSQAATWGHEILGIGGGSVQSESTRKWKYYHINACHINGSFSKKKKKKKATKGKTLACRKKVGLRLKLQPNRQIIYFSLFLNLKICVK